MHVPADVHPMGGVHHGKAAVLERWRLSLVNYDVVSYDTSDLIVERNRAAAEIPFDYRHKPTGKVLSTIKANFWTLEDGWPVRLTEYYDVACIKSFVGSIAA